MRGALRVGAPVRPGCCTVRRLGGFNNTQVLSPGPEARGPGRRQRWLLALRGGSCSGPLSCIRWFASLGLLFPGV